MRQGSIRLGRVLGVPLTMDLGVIAIAGVLTWSLATVVLPGAAPGHVAQVYWALGALGTVCFLASLLAHEFGHALVARRNGVRPERITLWILGGYAEFENEPETPGAELRITVAGPAVSLVLGVSFAAAAWGLDLLGVSPVHIALLAWLALVNGALGALNLLPGAPLDGGRILAAFLWRVSGDRFAARINAAFLGQLLGAALIALGLFELFAFRGLSGIAAIVVGWFLMSAARNERAYFVGEQALQGVTTGQAMVPTARAVTAWTTVADLVQGPLLHTHRSAVAVTGWTGSPVAVVTMADVRGVPAEDWANTTVSQIVGADSLLGTPSAEEDLLGFIERRQDRPGGYAVVVDDDGRPAGLIGPDEVRCAIERGRGRARQRRRHLPPPPPVTVPSQRWEPPVVANR
ncbi:MAG: site-2 protease family protein [Actinomycetota bacterium]|nr:site-2 protease family protein [Actinomycetota bacterium]